MLEGLPLALLVLEIDVVVWIFTIKNLSGLLGTLDDDKCDCGCATWLLRDIKTMLERCGRFGSPIQALGFLKARCAFDIGGLAGAPRCNLQSFRRPSQETVLERCYRSFPKCLRKSSWRYAHVQLWTREVDVHSNWKVRQKQTAPVRRSVYNKLHMALC